MTTSNLFLYHKHNRRIINKGVKHKFYLLRFKILILSPVLVKNNLTNFIRKRNFQISRNKTVKDLKAKIIRCLNSEISNKIDIKKNNLLSNPFFHIINPEFTSESQNEIYNIVNCYYNKYSQYKQKLKGRFALEKTSFENKVIVDGRVVTQYDISPEIATWKVVDFIKENKEDFKDFFVGVDGERIETVRLKDIVSLDKIPADGYKHLDTDDEDLSDYMTVYRFYSNGQQLGYLITQSFMKQPQINHLQLGKNQTMQKQFLLQSLLQ